MKNLAVPILLYHRIGAGANATSPEVFLGHMRALHCRGVHVLSLNEFEKILSGEVVPSRPSVHITFDDGSATGQTEALPVLAGFDFSATSFLITGRMAGSHAYSDALSWHSVRQMKESGVFSFQSHSHTHCRWDCSVAGVAAVRRELEMSRQTLLEELGGSSDSYCHLAWPWGRCSVDFEMVALELGYSFQYLVQRGAVSRSGSKLRLPRLCCDGMPIETFDRWIGRLTSPFPVGIVNGFYGSLRKIRHGLAYT